MKFIPTTLIFVLLISLATAAFAHHSYAGYNTSKKKQIKGTVVSWTYRAPHPQLVIAVEVAGKKGEEPILEQWKFEGISIMRWRQLNAPTDIAFEGEKVSVKGWPAKDGSHSMLLSGIKRESGKYIEILDRVRQGEGQR